MTTIELEIALLWYLNYRKNITVPNVSWGINFKGVGTLHECDILSLSKAGYATEIEIKVSKSDIKKDAAKPHLHDHIAIKNLFFAVPESLVCFALENIPERAGLLSVKGIKGYNVKQIRPPITNKNALKWNEQQRLKLAHLGCMRICSLKSKYLKSKSLI